MALTTGQIWFRVILGIATLGGGYIVYSMIKNNAQKADDTATAQAQATAAAKAGSPDAPRLQKEATAIATTPDGFPLQLGSTDAKTSGAVTQMQQWMISQNSSALPTYGADGKFGTETQTWVVKLISSNGQVTQDWYNANVLNPAPPLVPNSPLANVPYDPLAGIIPSGFDGDNLNMAGRRFDMENNFTR